MKDNMGKREIIVNKISLSEQGKEASVDKTINFPLITSEEKSKQYLQYLENKDKIKPIELKEDLYPKPILKPIEIKEIKQDVVKEHFEEEHHEYHEEGHHEEVRPNSPQDNYKVSEKRMSPRSPVMSEKKMETDIEKKMGDPEGKVVGYQDSDVHLPDAPAPTIEELRQRGQVPVSRSVGSMDTFRDTDETRKRKEVLLRNLEKMRRQYPDKKFTEFTEHSDIGMMERYYKMTYTQLLLDDNIDTFRQILMFGFMGMEALAVRVLGIEEFQGYAKNRIKNMNRYNSMLVELGEKSYTTMFSEWPVEVRLLGMIVIDTIFFVISKKLNFSVGSMIETFLGSSINKETEEETKKPKKKMRGPSIDPIKDEEVEARRNPIQIKLSPMKSPSKNI